jgi:hypothetical protein
MKTLARILIAVMVVFLMGLIIPRGADANGGHGGGGYRGGAGYYGGGYRGYGGYYGGGYRGYGGHGGVNIWLGPVWGPGWWGSYPYPYPYTYPYYQVPPLVINQQPEVYVQPAPQLEQKQIYWYYCENPNGYYPYVKQCPGGWMKIVPTPPNSPPN